MNYVITEKKDDIEVFLTGFPTETSVAWSGLLKSAVKFPNKSDAEIAVDEIVKRIPIHTPIIKPVE